MIVDAIISLIKAALTPLFAVLPTGSPIASTLDSWRLSGTLSAIGAKAAPFNALFPLTEIAALLNIVCVYILPVVLTYKIANWIYRHIPQLWGFGPGSG